MKEIFEQYGGVLITVTAIIAVIVVIIAVIGTDADGVIGQAFSTLINGFISRANSKAGF